MTRPLIRRTIRHIVVAGLAAATLLSAHAQSMSADSGVDWRRANAAVGQFKRGHADVLKWEAANLFVEKEPSAGRPDLRLMTAQEVVRLAWKNHRDLATLLAALGTANVELIASGQWMEFDRSWLYRVDHLDEVLDVAAQARKSWLAAISARQLLRYQRDAVVSAEAAAELGQRMADVGNWSQLQQAPVRIALNSARIDLKRAEYTAAQAQADLIKVLQLGGVHSSVDLPETLPELPSRVLTPDELRQHLAEVMAALPRAEGLQANANAPLAYEAYQASHAMALASRDVLNLRIYIADETVLHYNGMLKSVWDVLGEARNRSQAAVDAVGMQRDFWIAEADLQWVLLGGAPERFVSLGGSSGSSASAGH